MSIKRTLPLERRNSLGALLGVAPIASPDESREVPLSPAPRDATQRRVVVALLGLYTLWFRYTRDVCSRHTPWGPRWLANALSLLLTRTLHYSGSPLKSVRLPDPPIDPTKQHLVVWHPHGAYTCMAFGHCAYQAFSKSPLFWNTAVTPVLFRIPILRELLLLFGARSVHSSVVSSLVAAGANVGIQPGGVPEQLQADHRREVAHFPPRLGFIRLAMKHGIPLLPAYVFGENQAYTTLGEVGRVFSRAIFRVTGVPFVPVLGKWKLPWLVPRNGDIHIRWGQPVGVGPPNDNPTDAQVEQVFAAYVQALQAVFEAHKYDCLPADVAAKGLTISLRAGAHLSVSPRSRL